MLSTDTARKLLLLCESAHEELISLQQLLLYVVVVRLASAFSANIDNMARAMPK